MKLRWSIPLAFVSFLVFLSPSLSFCHPHVFITNRLTIVFDEKGLAGIRVEWVFDEFFSSMIAGDYDHNRNDKLEDSEISVIKKEAFSYLVNFDYFTFIKINGKPFKVKYVRDFSASLSKGRLIYEFFVPCHVRAVSAYKKFTISQYDPSYYTAVFFASEQPVIQEGGADFETIYHDIAENKNESYYYGMIHPVELNLEFRVKNA